MAHTREKLGGRAAFSHREYVYRARDGFEIDEIEGYDVTRRRVFYDDVLQVTLHNFRPWAGVAAALILAFVFGFLAAAVGAAARSAAWGFGVFLVTGAPALVYAILLVSLGGEAVTVQGRRSHARMHFGLRRRRAREVYRVACRLVRERQQRLAREAPARAPVPAPPPPVADAAS